MQLVSGLTRLDLTASLHTNSNIISYLTKSNLVKREISFPFLSFLCLKVEVDEGSYWPQWYIPKQVKRKSYWSTTIQLILQLNLKQAFIFFFPSH